MFSSFRQMCRVVSVFVGFPAVFHGFENTNRFSQCFSKMQIGCRSIAFLVKLGVCMGSELFYSCHSLNFPRILQCFSFQSLFSQFLGNSDYKKLRTLRFSQFEAEISRASSFLVQNVGKIFYLAKAAVRFL